ncbi:NifU-like protein [Thalassoglobus neptunius]|uniref:NifU-like protein n=1 Tax=Thalassoglobus neptunius TaxID=1938619 RepID=A0A5C5VY50_9PLAN|nr:iron-sulfur cluster assembly scaffold protein [Thalassoglobus neptunius]TWT43067.1 NifU-like protein [Thalassoglobus neptunius]
MSRFSAILTEHAMAPLNRGQLEHADGIGVVGTPGRGPAFALYLAIDDHLIKDARFQCNGCGTLVACGSMLTESIRDKHIEEITSFWVEELIQLLGGVPTDKTHCPDMALRALNLAVEDYQSTNSESRSIS